MRWQFVMVVLLVHQRTPKNTCAEVTAAPAAQLVSSSSVQNSGAGKGSIAVVTELPLEQLVRAALVQNCRVCIR